MARPIPPAPIRSLQLWCSFNVDCASALHQLLDEVDNALFHPGFERPVPAEVLHTTSSRSSPSSRRARHVIHHLEVHYPTNKIQKVGKPFVAAKLVSNAEISFCRLSKGKPTVLFMARGSETKSGTAFVRLKKGDASGRLQTALVDLTAADRLKCRLDVAGPAQLSVPTAALGE